MKSESCHVDGHHSPLFQSPEPSFGADDCSLTINSSKSSRNGTYERILLGRDAFHGECITLLLGQSRHISSLLRTKRHVMNVLKSDDVF